MVQTLDEIGYRKRKAGKTKYKLLWSSDPQKHESLSQKSRRSSISADRIPTSPESDEDEELEDSAKKDSNEEEIEPTASIETDPEEGLRDANFPIARDHVMHLSSNWAVGTTCKLVWKRQLGILHTSHAKVIRR